MQSKGTLSMIEEVIIVIAAIALCLMLLSMVFNLWPSETTGSKGTPKQVSTFLAGKIDECFKRHNYGLDPRSAVCGEFVIDTNGTLTDADIAGKVDCSKTPKEDCIIVSVSRAKTYVSVEYMASERKVIIREFGCFSDDDCDDSDECTSDTCTFPGTGDSACTHRFTCADEAPTTCLVDSECFPEQCCHPTTCTLESKLPDCSDEECTEECKAGTMDCGQGQCTCQEGQCAVEWL